MMSTTCLERDSIKTVMTQLKESIQNAKNKISNNSSQHSRWVEISKNWYIYNIDINTPIQFVAKIFSCHLVVANAGAEMAPHIHEQNLRLIIFDGELRETETGHTIKNGEILEIPSNKRHGFLVTKPVFGLMIFIPPFTGEIHAI